MPKTAKGRVYFCAALLSDDQAASLSLHTRNNLLCALSSLSLSDYNVIWRDQLTTSEGKQKVVNRLIATTPPQDTKAILTKLNEPYNNGASTLTGEVVV